MKKSQRIISMLLIVIMVIGVFTVIPVSASATEDEIAVTGVAMQGTTGNCTWTKVDTELTISGNGAMGNYDSWEDAAPWGTDITKVTIENGVTNIGDYAFYYCAYLTDVSISNSVTSIGESAFESCLKLTSITIPDSVTSIDTWAFYDCKSLSTINLPDCVLSILLGMIINPTA